jgi:hypothetical protein
MMRRTAIAIAAATLCLVPATGAWAAGPEEHFTRHDRLVTVSCTGGSGFTADGNAYFGHQTETAAWNAGDHGTTCSASLD